MLCLGCKYGNPEPIKFDKILNFVFKSTKTSDTI